MSTSITPHLFVTTNYDLVNKIYYGIDRSYKTILDNLTEEELKSTIIVSRGRNNNLVSFEHSFGYLGENVSNIKLEMIDIDGGLNSFLKNVSFYPLMMQKLYESAALKSKEISNLDLSDLLNTDSTNAGIIGLDAYFFYGVTDDIKEWSGPYNGKLVNIEQNYSSEGIRSIVLEFATTPSPFFLNKLRSDQNNSSSSKIDRFSRMYLEKNSANLSVNTQLNSIAFMNAEKAKIFPTFRELIKSYLRDICKSENIIVLLPDIDPIFLRLYNDYRQSGYERLLEYKNNVDILNIPKDFVGAEKAAGYVAFQYPIELALNTLFKSMGINAIEFSNETLKTYPLVEQRVEYSDLIDKSYSTLILTIEAGLYQTQEYYKDKYAQYTDFFLPLKRIRDGYQKLFPEGLRDIIYYEETDIRILKLLKKHNIIKDDSKPAFIFGESSMIDYFVYLNVNIAANTIEVLKDNLKISTADSPANIANQIDLGIFNNDYRDEFYKTFYENFPPQQYGRNVKATKDELAFLQLEDNLVNNIPVFRCNTNNGNVTAFKTNININGMNAQQYGIKLRTDEIISTSLRELQLEQIRRELTPKFFEELNSIVSFTKSTTDGKDDTVETLYSLLLERFSKLKDNKNLSEYLRNIDSKQVTAHIVKLFYLNNLCNNSPYIRVSDDTGAKASALQNQILNYLYSYISDINIRTVPMFHLGSLAVKRMLVLFIMGKTKVVGSTLSDSDLLGYSGRYVITGYKHVIANNEMYSEFAMTKNFFKLPEIPRNIDDKLGDIIQDLKNTEKANEEKARIDKLNIWEKTARAWRAMGWI